ncbi:MAG: hypothetical protein E7013_05025 [Alphaproteobacteria bacterium]|nr:hypothetical protein [Alphaproteobacteria bacterium]
MQLDTSALSNILTQEEIDALLLPEEQKTETNPLNLLKNAQPAKKYPELEKKIDAFGRALIGTLHHLTQIENISVQTQSFIFGQLGAYLDTLPNPSMLGFYQVSDWRQSVLTVLDFNLAYCLLDATLGGRRGTSAMSLDSRNYTPIEKNILKNILISFSEDFSKSFEQKFKFETMDVNPKTALIASPACEIVICRLEVCLEKRKGILDFVLPLHLLSYIDSSDNVSVIDEYTENLATALCKVPLQLKAVLDKKEIPFKDILKWKVGDLLPLTYFEDKPLELSCQNQCVFKGALEVNKKNISVKIEKKMFEAR